MLIAGGIFLLTAAFAAETLPQIRKTVQIPFYSNGKRIEAVWKQADTLTGFVNPLKASVEPFTTRAQMLYDDNNLYLSLGGWSRPAWKADRNIKRSLFKDNNFEFFIQPDPAKNVYYQIAVSENGQLHTGVNRNKTELPGIRKSIVSGKDHWYANLTIPLPAIGLKAPAQAQTVRFNVCRYNIDMPKGKEQQSSFAVLDGSPNYHMPDQWNGAVMTPDSGTAAVVRSQSDKVKVNLLPDPGFDFVSREFKNPDIQRVETAPLSDIWLIRATGNAYHFYGLWVDGLLKPGREYTLRVRGRRIGKEGSFGAIQIARTPDGKFKEGGPVAWGIPFTEEFQEYYLPFKAAEGTVTLALYRLGTRGKETGIEVENISLFEGKISSFEIRKVARAGIKKIIPGTEIRLPENRYGKSPETLNVLVIGDSLMSLTDPREVISGLNVKADMLTTTGTNADVYYTDEDPKAIFAKMDQGAYDLYMIGGRGVPGKIGKELAKRIVKNVQNGAGLLLNAPAPYGNLAAPADGAQPVDPAHYLKQGLPVEFHVRPPSWSNWNHDPLCNIREGKTGKGRVVTAQASYVNHLFQMRQDSDVYASSRFPWAAFNKAWLARMMYYAAGKVPQSFGTVTVSGGMANAMCSGMPDSTAVMWEITDKNGQKEAAGKSVVRNNSVSVSLPALHMNGRHVLALHALDGNGRTLDYTAKTFMKQGPVLAGIKDNKLFYKEDEEADLSVSISDFAPGMSLEWSLEDFSGRILESGSADAAPQTSFKVPLKSLYTNLGNVSVTLKQKGKILDTQRITVIAQDRDKKRLVEDFTPSLWHFGTDIPQEFGEAVDRQFEKIGFRCYLMPFRRMGDLAAGMGVGGNYRGGGDMFCGWPQKNNIRAQQFNTEQSRKAISDRAEKWARNDRQLGVIHDALCDEPNLVRPGTGAELDEHPDNVAEFRRRMTAKYGSIGNYNKRMGTAHRSFEEIGPARMKEARESGRYAEFMEWRNFNTDRWCEIIRTVSEAAKKGDPNSALSLYNSFGQGALGGNDYWKLLTKAGLGFSQEYTSMVYQGSSPIYEFDEFYRSFRPDMRVWGFTGYYFSRDKSFFQPWWFALHRYGGFTWFAAFSGMGSGGGGAWLNMLDYTGAYTEDAKNMQESLERSGLLDGLGKVFLEYQWAPNDIAVYYSHNSMLLSFIRGKETNEGEIHAGGPLRDYFQSRHNIRYLLEELLYQYDFLAPEQISNGRLNDRKILFLPGISAMSDQEIVSVRTFLAKGGVAITDFLPGTHDELGMKRAASPFAGEKNMVVLGKIFNDKDQAQRQQIFGLLAKAGAKQIVGSHDAVKVRGREAMHFADGNMHIFAVVRNQTRSSDTLEQTFTFPVKGHVYDLRAGKYLGKTDRITAEVPHGEASVWGVYPYQVGKVEIQAPVTVGGGRDFTADLQITASRGIPGKHVFHVEVLPPDRKARFFMKRNLTAENGKAKLIFRMAENDPEGDWLLRVTDVMTGVSAEHRFTLR